jgi:hypothetical protein
VGFAHRDVVVHVEVAVGIAGLIQPDEGSFDDEEHSHRIFVLMCDQRVSFSRGLIDKVARGSGPVVFQVTPFSRDRIGENLVRMVVAVDEPGPFRHQDVAPFVLLGRNPQGP